MSATTCNLVRRIREAATAAELWAIRRTELPHLLGITDKERSQLGDMISKRFSEINAAATVPAFPRGRWS